MPDPREAWRLTDAECRAIADAAMCAFGYSTDSIYRAMADAAAKKALEWAAQQVPTNWCDPLLTGPNAALPKVDEISNRDIEALLRRIQDRIRGALKNTHEGLKRG